MRDRGSAAVRFLSEDWMTTIYVGNLPFNATEQDVRSSSSVTEGRFGQAHQDRETGKPRGFGFVEMPDEAKPQSRRSTVFR